MKAGDKTTLSLSLGLLTVCYLLSRLEVVADAFGFLTLRGLDLICRGLSLGITCSADEIYTGKVQIPWTEDCSGMNLLLILLAIGAWLSRGQVLNGKWIARMLCLFPAAVVANILRVFLLIGYRTFAYPLVESQQLHYFIGFVCVLPFSLLAGQGLRCSSLYMVLQTSAVMCLLAPLVDQHAGIPLALSCVLLLSGNRFSSPVNRLYFFVWASAAWVVFYTGIHSLWLPWVIACPFSFGFRKIDMALLPFACPVVYLFEPLHWLGWLITGLYVWRKFYNSEEGVDCEISAKPAVTGVLFFTLPFVLPVLFSTKLSTQKPPADAAVKNIPGGYELRIPGQPGKMGLVWYEANGSERHHSLKTCLKYRGVDLQKAEGGILHTDGRHWFREYFLVDGKLLESHLSYLRATLGIRKSPGVHVIAVARMEDFDEQQFSLESRKLVSRVSGN